MDPSKTDRLVEALVSAVEKGEGFLERELPAYASEIVAWVYWSSVIGLILGVVMMLASGVFAYAAHRLADTDRKENFGPPSPSPLVCVFIGICLFAGGLVCIANCTASVIKASVAPRLVIVESLRGK